MPGRPSCTVQAAVLSPCSCVPALSHRPTELLAAAEICGAADGPIRDTRGWLRRVLRPGGRLRCAGIGRSINSIDQIDALQRPLTMEHGGIVLMDLLWSDPTTNDGAPPAPVTLPFLHPLPAPLPACALCLHPLLCCTNGELRAACRNGVRNAAPLSLHARL